MVESIQNRMEIDILHMKANQQGKAVELEALDVGLMH